MKSQFLTVGGHGGRSYIARHFTGSCYCCLPFYRFRLAIISLCYAADKNVGGLEVIFTLFVFLFIAFLYLGSYLFLSCLSYSMFSHVTQHSP